MLPGGPGYSAAPRKAFLILLAFGFPGLILNATEYAPDPLCGPGPPDQVFPVQVAGLVGGATRLTWPGQYGYRFDIVRGSLAGLSTTGGDYALATSRCLADDLDDQLFDDAELPELGDGYWYLLRADWGGDGCPYGAASYAPQFGSSLTEVDIGIRSSGRDCTCFFSCQ